MAREKESYRDNLERLDLFFPQKELLSPADVSRYLGVDRISAMRMFSFTCRKVGKTNRHHISKAVLARELS